MKTLKSFMLLVGILLGSTVFYSCLDDDDAYSEFWRDSVQAIVTVKPLSDNSYYMQLDDSTTLFPTNSYVPENLKEIRAFVVYKNDEKKTEGYDQSVQLLRMDTLLTKPIAPDLGSENDSYYGTDMLALNGVAFGQRTECGSRTDISRSISIFKEVTTTMSSIS